MGLGSILGTLGGIVGAPFTGGASMAIGPMLGGLADTFGGAAKASQGQDNESDKLKLLLENSKLNRDKFALDAPGTRLGTSMRASLANNFTPSKLDWGPNGFVPGAIAHGQAQLPTRTGGMAAGMQNLDPQTKQLSNQTIHDELVSQMRGGETGGGNGPGTPYSHPDGTGTDKAMPTGIGDARTGTSIVGGLGLGTSILSVLSKLQGLGGGGNGTSYEPNFDNGVG